MPLRSKAKSDVLKSVPLFEHCSRRELGKIAAITEEIAVEDGEVLITEGDRGRDFFVIISGEVEVRRKGRRVATLGPGTYFGEIALLSQQPRTATVRAVTPLRLLAIADRDFVELLDAIPELWL
jgi:CRP-like cAMP-binding protein